MFGLNRAAVFALFYGMLSTVHGMDGQKEKKVGFRYTLDDMSSSSESWVTPHHVDQRWMHDRAPQRRWNAEEDELDVNELQAPRMPTRTMLDSARGFSHPQAFVSPDDELALGGNSYHQRAQMREAPTPIMSNRKTLRADDTDVASKSEAYGTYARENVQNRQDANPPNGKQRRGPHRKPSQYYPSSPEGYYF